MFLSLSALPHQSSYLVHDGVLRVFGFDDGRLHEVALLIVTRSSSDHFQVRGRLGVFEPLLYATKRLQEEIRPVMPLVY